MIFPRCVWALFRFAAASLYLAFLAGTSTGQENELAGEYVCAEARIWREKRWHARQRR
jgi:hypothetical protein